MIFILLAVIIGIVLAPIIALSPFFPKKKVGALFVISISVALVVFGAYVVFDAYDAPSIYDVKKIDYLTNDWEELGLIYAYDGYVYDGNDVVEGRYYRSTEDNPVRFVKGTTEEVYLVIYETPLKEKWSWANIGLDSRYEYVFITPDPVTFAKSTTEEGGLVTYETLLNEKWHWTNIESKNRYEYVVTTSDEEVLEDSK